MGDRRIQLFRQVTKVVYALFFLVIVAGTTVRILGAGMGCPDWPTCYGKLIPPWKENQLPKDYRVQYAVSGRLAEPFDAFKTWAEYLNRLIGALSGAGIVGLFAYSWLFLRKYGRVVLFTSLTLMAMGVQFVLGWQVVKAWLAERVVSLHYLFALGLTLLMGEVLLSTYFAAGVRVDSLKAYTRLGWTGWGLLILQVILGTEVRAMASKDIPQALGSAIFYVHRSLSWVVMGLVGYYFWRVFVEPTRFPLSRQWAIYTIGAIVLQFFAGVLLSYWRWHGALQVVHALMGLLVCNTLYLSLRFLRQVKYALV
ncbi:MAG: COX15/CtaA family protein [Bacteroidia bacterium]